MHITGACSSQITITIAAARALLAFAGKDETRPNVAIGVSGEGALCATDGHTLLRLAGIPLSEEWRGLYWDHETVLTLVKVARAQKRDTIDLDRPVRMAYPFPPVSQVFPAARGVCSLVTVNPDYLARMMLVADACAESKRSRPGVTLIAGEEMGPQYWVIARGREIKAEVLIMPMRQADVEKQAVCDLLTPDSAEVRHAA